MNLRRKRTVEVSENSTVYLNEGGSSGGGYTLRSCPDYTYLPSGGAGGIASVGDSFLQSMKKGSGAGSYWSANAVHGAYQSRPGSLLTMIFSWFIGAFFVKR